MAFYAENCKRYTFINQRCYFNNPKYFKKTPKSYRNVQENNYSDHYLDPEERDLDPEESLLDDVLCELREVPEELDLLLGDFNLDLLRCLELGLCDLDLLLVRFPELVDLELELTRALIIHPYRGFQIWTTNLSERDRRKREPLSRSLEGDLHTSRVSKNVLENLPQC